MDLALDALIDTIAVPATTDRLAAVAMGDIPTSSQISGLEVRLSRVLIKDNCTPKLLLLPGRANLYLMLVVLDNLSKEPTTVTVNGFADIDDNEDLPVDKTAYCWNPAPGQTTAPNQVHVMLSVLKSKKELRADGQLLATAKASPAYQSAVAELLSAVAGAPAKVADLALGLGGIVGGFLANVEDKPLFTQVVSFTDINGDFDALGKTVHAQENRCVRTELTLVVRDKAREQALSAAAQGPVSPAPDPAPAPTPAPPTT